MSQCDLKYSFSLNQRLTHDFIIHCQCKPIVIVHRDIFPMTRKVDTDRMENIPINEETIYDVKLLNAFVD